MNNYLELSTEVKEAQANNLPIVALESTIISHGMPYPKNVETAKHCEQIIRDNGAIPATIAIIDGKLKVGLTNDELLFLGKEGQAVQKTSRRDLAHVISKRLTGATTVSATMYIAALAGIKLFATGGIGGVHRNAEDTFDISADLEEFKTTSVNVVCAGAKSILDLGKTLEYLETNGISVIGYNTFMLPAFYTRESDYTVDFNLKTPSEIARFIHTKETLDLPEGTLITNPIPKDKSFCKEKIDSAIENALAEMTNLGIKGKETTPFLLEKIVELTKGKSLEANIALVYNNCELAAKIAVSYNEMRD
ncbi:MAG: pseudouridine-5'-phosphate glycosidase [Candidatus Izimaplasma sp.]|nr:pseudouridine-5'-phosphate glycosidase [Candidatus Izimaplasma bacterium]